MKKSLTHECSLATVASNAAMHTRDWYRHEATAIVPFIKHDHDIDMGANNTLPQHIFKRKAGRVTCILTHNT